MINERMPVSSLPQDILINEKSKVSALAYKIVRTIVINLDALIVKQFEEEGGGKDKFFCYSAFVLY